MNRRKSRHECRLGKQECLRHVCAEGTTCRAPTSRWGRHMDRKIAPARSVSGKVRLPGDKSISHRYAMLAALAEGRSVIKNFATGADCSSTLECLRQLGADIQREGDEVVIEGVGLGGLSAPRDQLDAGNSGSTIRMLSGILAGQGFESVIGGDESLSRRPMRRIITPLTRMGAQIIGRDGDFPPLRIQGAELQPIEYELPVASAQVKTSVLFAGLFAEGITIVREPLPTRDHSEIALRQFGAEIDVGNRRIELRGRPRLRALQLAVPSDLSTAVFFLAAGLLAPHADLTVQRVGLNPTRTAVLDVLREMGADLEILPCDMLHGEPLGDVRVRGSESASGAVLKGGRIEGQTTAEVIDELPILAVLGAASEEGLTIRDASELRFKESDRIATVAENLTRMGVEVEVLDDGMHIPGRQKFRAAKLDSFGDHRVAMAFSVAALRADGPCVIRNAEAASVSFPGFFEVLDQVVDR